MKPKIWMYWDHKPGYTEAPAYIKLCWNTIHKHCGNDFEIYLVTSDNVKQFLPNIPDTFFQISQINNKSNYLRYMLLREHGGVWLDSDIILFKSLKPILNLLKNDIDLVATASPTLKYGEPECGILVSTKGGKIITKATTLIQHTLDLYQPGHVFQWGSMGPGMIRQAVNGYKYHHLDHHLLMPVASWESFRFEGKESVDKYCDKESYGTMLFNEMFRQSNSPFLRMSRQELLDSSTLLGQILRKAME